MPRGGSGADWTDCVTKVLELEEQINAEIKSLCRVKREINEAIDAVEDMRYRTLLEMRYRLNLSWERIADKMCYDVRHITRLHGEALREVKVPQECP